MGFKLRSGNKTGFKQMGSSPAKEITKEGQARLDEQAKRAASHKKYLEKDDNRSKFKKDERGILRNAEGKTVAEMNPQSPAKQKYTITWANKEAEKEYKEQIRKEEEKKKKDQLRIQQQIEGTYVETEEDIKRRKEDARRNSPRKISPTKQRKVFKDDGGKDWKNRHAVKSDAQKKVDAMKKWWAQASSKEKAEYKAKKEAQRKAFEKEITKNK